MSRNMDGEECYTAKCSKQATKRLRAVHEYDSAMGGVKTTELEAVYCDQHAEMWLKLDGVARTRYEVIEDG